jgi:hypothetical protein
MKEILISKEILSFADKKFLLFLKEAKSITKKQVSEILEIKYKMF